MVGVYNIFIGNSRMDKLLQNLQEKYKKEIYLLKTQIKKNIYGLFGSLGYQN